MTGLLYKMTVIFKVAVICFYLMSAACGGCAEEEAHGFADFGFERFLSGNRADYAVEDTLTR
jgi:hypothetical protein